MWGCVCMSRAITSLSEVDRDVKANSSEEKSVHGSGVALTSMVRKSASVSEV